MSARAHTLTVGLFMVIALFGGTPVHAQTGTVVGSVHVTMPDGEIIAIPGVRVTLTCGDDTLSNVSNEYGQFQFTQLPAGRCALVTDIQGFQPVSAAVERTGTERTDVPLSLEFEELYTGLMVTGGSPGVPFPASETGSDWRTYRRNAGNRFTKRLVRVARVVVHSINRARMPHTANGRFVQSGVRRDCAL